MSISIFDQEKPSEIYFNAQTNFELTQKVFENMLVNLFNVFYFLYQAQNSELRIERVRTQYYAHCLHMIVYTIQLLSLTLPTPQKEDNEQFKEFFYGVSIFRPDFTTTFFGIGHAFYYLTIFLIAVPSLSLVKLYISFICDHSSIKRNYILLLVWPMNFIKNYGFIACLSILLSVYKYSTVLE